nr:MAG TPA: hypothetical protein [Caudoviricetes sp.]
MAKVKYVPIPLDMAEDIEELSDEEIGLVVRAYLQYGRSGETAEMPRTIKYLYNALVRELDRASDGYEKKIAAGKSGGRGRPKKEPSEEIQQPESAQLNPEPEQKPKSHTPAPFISDEEAAEIQQGTNEVLDEAKRQGFPDTTATMETLNKLVADNSAEEVLECVKIAGEAGKPNIRYLKGVINGRAKERQEEERQARIDAEKYPVVSSADYDYKPPSVTFGEVFKKYAKQRALEHPEERVKLEELAGRFS